MIWKWMTDQPTKSVIPTSLSPTKPTSIIIPTFLGATTILALVFIILVDVLKVSIQSLSMMLVVDFFVNSLYQLKDIIFYF